MSSIALIAAFTLVFVVALVVGGVGYLVHRYPALATPVGVMAVVAGVFATSIIPIAVR
ncbi:hypothetical protein ACFWNF_39470 [Streptomyces anulatus]|uniref:hypothetical protein n=1 Tax=Streptomyces anulatus TaxID=1892 RepID=UPI0036697B99